ncbi:MAG: signal transduction histidine kinase [Deltaproteobacteria bacterium]|nr:signal transduction histidine kinase [Deltaproteobacteria bacterium]
MALHTVLVVDDEPASVRAVTRALQAEARVVGTTSAAQALAALATEPIALLIVDHRMPEMTGTELLARTAAQCPDAVRILLTGYTDIGTLIDAINAGHVYHYLTKPWEPQALRLVVRRGLERYEAEADRRRLLADLEQAYQRARRETEQKSRLLTVASHELGTPLHILASALEFLSESELPPPARTWLDTATRNAEWLARGLAQMATAARCANRELRLRPIPTDLTVLLNRLRATFAPIVVARQLTLQCNVEEALPALNADPLWLERALFNLLSNAVRFTPDGGVIRLAARVTQGAVEISVSDTGIGIDAQLLDVVFEPLSAAGGDIQLHTSGRFEFGARGLGLGLAITKEIIAHHGGSIAVCSESGVGSRFTVTLPLRAADDG